MATHAAVVVLVLLDILVITVLLIIDLCLPEGMYRSISMNLLQKVHVSMYVCMYMYLLNFSQCHRKPASRKAAYSMCVLTANGANDLRQSSMWRSEQKLH